MIEKVLEAYVEKTSGKGSLWEKIDKMNTLSKFFFWGSIVLGFAILIGNLIFQSQEMIFVMVGYVVVLYIITIILERIRHKKWKINLKKYNEDLDIIAQILKQEEFQLYEKNKIKQLICKYNKSIEQQDNLYSKRSSKMKEFICTYLIPIITFFAGKLSITNSSNDEWIAICLVIIFILISGKYIHSGIMEMIAIISWNQLEKEKYFVLKLQDLLDRDFIIEQNDLILSR